MMLFLEYFYWGDVKDWDNKLSLEITVRTLIPFFFFFTMYSHSLHTSILLFDLPNKIILNKSFIFCFFLFMATLSGYGYSQAWDCIWAAAMNYPTAAAMPDPLTHCAGPVIESATLQRPEPLQSDSWLTVPQWELKVMFFLHAAHFK